MRRVVTLVTLSAPSCWARQSARARRSERRPGLDRPAGIASRGDGTAHALGQDLAQITHSPHGARVRWPSSRRASPHRTRIAPAALRAL